VKRVTIMTETDFLLPGPAKGSCECGREGCELYGTLKKPDRNGKRHVRGCECPVCRGRNNRSKGDSKARRARKALNIPGANSRHEEVWGGNIRVEIKAGAQVGPIATRFDTARAQSEAARAIGDHRPFVMVAMPDDTRDGIVLCRLSDIAEVAYAIASQMTTPG
jgi:hypothetical protein